MTKGLNFYCMKRLRRFAASFGRIKLGFDLWRISTNDVFRASLGVLLRPFIFIFSKLPFISWYFVTAYFCV